MPVYVPFTRSLQLFLASAAAGLIFILLLLGLDPATAAAPAEHVSSHEIYYVNAAVDDGLVGYWRLNAITDTTAVDVSPYRNQGTVSGAGWSGDTPAAIHFDNPGSASFDGIDDYIEIPDGDAIDFDTDDEFTIALWVKIPSADQPDLANPDNAIVEKWSQFGAYPYVIRYLNTGANKGKIVAARYDGTNNPNLFSTSTLNDDTYHHVAFVRRGGTLYLYVDGTEEASTADTTTGPTTNSSALFLGRRGNGINHFQGLIDDLRIYNRPLTVAEIADLAAGKEHDGTSWADPFSSLERALGTAGPGEAIWVAQGIYTPTNGINRTASFYMKDGVSVYGGFDGSETALSGRDWAGNPTILSGDLDGNDLTEGGVVTDTDHITGTNAFHVVVADNITNTAAIDGFTVTAGQAIVPTDFSERTEGGGMLALSSDVNISHMIFEGNRARNGGGLSLTDSLTEIKNAVIMNNTVSATSIGASRGGGLFIFGGQITLNDVVIKNNKAENGGGLTSQSGSHTLEKVVFANNEATNWGGGADLSNDSWTFVDVIFQRNVARIGGGIYAFNADYSLTNALFVSNSAVNDGGAIYNNWDTDPTLTYVTISGNLADISGGGIFNKTSFFGTSDPEIYNSVVWGNSAPTGSEMASDSGSTPVVMHSLIGTTVYTGTGNVAAAVSPFISDPDPGPDATWGTADDDYGNLRQNAGSPGIDSGLNILNPAGTFFDIAGNPRIQNGTVDMGAYERNVMWLPVVKKEVSQSGD